MRASFGQLLHRVQRDEVADLIEDARCSDDVRPHIATARTRIAEVRTTWEEVMWICSGWDEETVDTANSMRDWARDEVLRWEVALERISRFATTGGAA